MKTILLASILFCLYSCGTPKADAQKKNFKIVCGDSVETELFDPNGNAYYERRPGTCDTVYTNE